VKQGGAIVLVRHGETAYNKKGEAGVSAERVRGWKDIPLDDTGKKQAKQIAKDIASKHNVARVLCSPLSRAKETAQNIVIACHLSGTGQPIVVEDLRPWNVGEFTGKPVADVLPEMKRLALPENENEKVPGGESFREFADRFLRCLMQRLRIVNMSGETHVLTTHTRNLQLARAWLSAGADDDGKYDATAMNDYSREVPTGGDFVIRTKPREKTANA
jgi:broad specificity phosphatase PhoE